MKIKNIEKFRNELYAALKDGSWLPFDDSAECVIIAEHENSINHERLANSIPVWREVNGETVAVALYRPLKVLGTDYFVTVDVDADVSLWKHVDGGYQFEDFVPTNNYNRMTIAVRACEMVDRAYRRAKEV